MYLAVLNLAAGLARPFAAAEPEEAMKIENEYARYVLGADGTNQHFIDRQTGTDYGLQEPRVPFARIRQAGREIPASAAAYADGRLTVDFGASGVRAEIGVTAEPHYFVWEVLSLTGEGVEEFNFVDLPLTLRGAPEEPFAGCALALNLQTRVPEIPRANSRLRAFCYPRFGFAGAKVALIGCPQSELRAVLQEVVRAAPDLPHSPIGGPWALDGEHNNGSYLFNFGNLSEETVDDWIRVAQSLGINQIDFHGGGSFRFGDCRPNPQTYPRGLESMKAVIDKLHAAGILAGLHTYAMFMSKDCPWVTPVPDPRLGKDATFTLAAALDAEATTVPVEESTEKMSTVTGFFVRNSVTLQIDDELIVYRGLSKEPPYAFTDCQRGAYGTLAAPHAPGAKVHHLRECFGLFVPDGDSTLFEEVAARTAETFNEAGFDMIYLDALDGGDTVAGPENAWHYESKFAFEIWKRLKKPAIMEMSTFHHHLWYVRSRLGAWDHPNRSYKKFIDIHCAANEEHRRMFLPGHLGWWAFKTWSGAQGEPTFADDIEYLCLKALATDTGLSIMGINPDNVSQIPALPRFAAIMKRYEDLRRANVVPESVKAKLRVPGEEFTLLPGPEGKWQFQPVQYAKHKVENLEGWSNVWTVNNKFDRQPLRLRIEALLSAGAYDAPDNIVLANFGEVGDFPERATAQGMTVSLQPSSDQVKVGPASGCLTASNTLAKREGTWAMVGKKFSPPLDLSPQQGLGVWVYGDGQGEVLNLQLRSPSHLSNGIGDHYIVVDFTGWRYFELVEPEGERYAAYQWPYGDVYSIYRESVNYGQVESLSLWVNHLPPNGTVTCYLSPIKALPLMPVKLRHPSVTVGGRTLAFPVEIESGSYLEFHSLADCKLYGPQGELLGEVQPEGEVPVLEAGENRVQFTGDVSPDTSARAYVTVISQGEPLSEG